MWLGDSGVETCNSGEINKGKGVSTMVEPTRRLVEHAFYSQKVKREGSKTAPIGFVVSIDDCPMTNEELTQMLDILREAAEKASKIMGW
jgi:hypothetical protein